MKITVINNGDSFTLQHWVLDDLSGKSGMYRQDLPDPVDYAEGGAFQELGIEPPWAEMLPQWFNGNEQNITEEVTKWCAENDLCTYPGKWSGTDEVAFKLKFC